MYVISSSYTSSSFDNTELQEAIKSNQMLNKTKNIRSIRYIPRI